MWKGVVALALAGVLGSPGPAPPPTPGDWVTFSGVWSATGRRQTLPAEDGRRAALVQLSGALTVTSGPGLSRGFGGSAIGFDDGSGATVGRAVWTAASGDQIFSVWKGDVLGPGRVVTGTITGGTGRFARAVGDYTLTWQYLVHTHDDTVQGRAVDLRGRLRVGGSAS
jgi:hypothetical protein